VSKEVILKEIAVNRKKEGKREKAHGLKAPSRIAWGAEVNVHSRENKEEPGGGEMRRKGRGDRK